MNKSKKNTCNKINKKSLKNKLGQGTFGLVYKYCTKDGCYGIKFLTMKNKYVLDNTHPGNVEALIGLELLKLKIPHVNYVIKHDYCKINELKKLDIFKDDKWYTDVLEKYKNKIIYPNIKIIFNELADSDLKKYVTLNELSLDTHIILLFYFCYTLSSIQYHLKNFRHNDIKPNNILVKYNKHYKPNTYDVYIIFNKTFYIPCLPFTIKIHDFDYCYCSKYKNQKIMGYKSKKSKTKQFGTTTIVNPVYDLHEYVNFSLRDYKTLSEPIMEFYKSLIPFNTIGRGGTPDKYCNRYKLTSYHIDKKYNYIPSDMRSPSQLLLSLKEFDKFLVKPSNQIKNKEYNSNIELNSKIQKRNDMFNLQFNL